MKSLLVVLIVPALCELHRYLNGGEQLSLSPIICAFILLAI